MIFLKLIGFRNLLLIALAQLVFHFGLLKQQNLVLALEDWQFLLLVVATACIAAGGFLIQAVLAKNNPVYNSEVNAVSEATAYNLYAVLNIVGVGIGFYLSNLIGKPGFSGIFIITAATLYLYASSLKKSLIVGNLIIALVLAVSILIVGIYDLLAVITPENQPFLKVLFEIFIDYALFVFLLGFIREITGSLATVEQDLDKGSKTLPIVFGQRNTKIISTLLTALLISLLVVYISKYLFVNELYIATFYVMAVVLAPLLYVVVRLWNVDETKEYIQLSTILKGVLVLGVLSVLVIEFTK
ncbi:MAG: geranylgeranylglycerol-phosphate geranylgeranyltransferase [Flavobacteriaceae bacterium]